VVLDLQNERTWKSYIICVFVLFVCLFPFISMGNQEYTVYQMYDTLTMDSAQYSIIWCLCPVVSYIQ